ncbi:MAG TPA: Calx-beta domain-containing protein [Micromonosporaceae bacterium]
MKQIMRVTMAAVVGLGALVLAAPAQAGKPPGRTFSVMDSQSYEYRKDCSTQSPYPCTTSTQTLYVEIWTSTTVSQQVTFGYQIDPISATEGLDYTGTSGTAVMAANTNFAFIAIPVINDGVAESSETLRVRLTSSTMAGDISDTGTGTILNDGQIPADCSLSRSSLMVTSMECTSRPPTQTWQIQITCYDSGAWGYVRAYGQLVTGNGTSVVECTRVDYEYGEPYFYVQP